MQLADFIQPFEIFVIGISFLIILGFISARYDTNLEKLFPPKIPKWVKADYGKEEFKQ